MGKPAARLTDMHTCPMVTPGTPPIPHVGGPISGPCVPPVLIGFLPAATVGDMCVCVGPPDTIAMGSPTVFIGGKMAARMGDPTAHGGVITVGCPTVLIGEIGSGGATAPPSLLEAALTWIEDLVEDVLGEEKYSDGIVLRGSRDFRDKTRLALEQIAQTPTGKALLKSLNDSGKSVVIEPSKPFSDGSFGNYADPADPVAASIDANKNPGKGSDVTVGFRPDNAILGDGQGWKNRPPAIGLAHELVHAQHMATGTVDDTQIPNDKRPDPTNPKAFATAEAEEVRTAGIPPEDTGAFTENKIRSEWPAKQPARPYY